MLSAQLQAGACHTQLQAEVIIKQFHSAQLQADRCSSCGHTLLQAGQSFAGGEIVTLGNTVTGWLGREITSPFPP